MSNSLKGLTQDEVIRSREQYGANLLTPPKRKSLWRLFIEKFNTRCLILQSKMA